MSFWETLSEIARTLLIMSATGGIIALLLFALKPIIKNNIPVLCAPAQIHLTSDFEWELVSIIQLMVGGVRCQLEVQADTNNMELFQMGHDPFGAYTYSLEYLLETLKNLPTDDIKGSFDLLPDKYIVLVRQDSGMYLEILPMYAAEGGGYRDQGSDVIRYPTQQN